MESPMIWLLLSAALAAAPIPVTGGGPLTQTAPLAASNTEVSSGDGLSVEVYLDTSKSAGKHAKDDVALVEWIRAALRPTDLLRVTGFDGILYPVVSAESPMNDPGPALTDLKYAGLATFYAPIWFDVAAQAPSAGGRARVVIVATDGHSDPLNKSRGPAVSDPGWKDTPPVTLGETRVLWTLRDTQPAKSDTPSPSLWTEPSGVQSQLVAWNPPVGWAPASADLLTWLDALRPIPVSVVDRAPEAQPFDWAGLAMTAAKVGGVGLAVVLAIGGVLVGRRKASDELTKRAIDGALKAPRQALLRLEPTGGQPIERRIQPGDQMDVGPGVSWPGVVLALPGSGFSLTIGRRGDRATILPRGTRSAIAVLRNGQVLAVERNLPIEVSDGDVIADARTEAGLVKLTFTAA